MKCGCMTLPSLTIAPNTIRQAGFLVWNTVRIITWEFLWFTSESTENFFLSTNMSFSCTLMLDKWQKLWASLSSNGFGLGCKEVTASLNITSHAKVSSDTSRHCGPRHIAFLCESCHRCGWVGFNQVFEANKKPGNLLKITLSLVFFSINLGLFFKSFKNTNCCFRKFHQLNNVFCSVPSTSLHNYGRTILLFHDFPWGWLDIYAIKILSGNDFLNPQNQQLKVICKTLNVCVWVYSCKIQKKTSKWMFTFWLGGKWRMLFLIGHFQFKSSIAIAFWLFFIGVCHAVLCTWWTFHRRITCQNNNFSRVAWASKYEVGRPETSKDPKNITDEVILHTLWVCDYKYIYIYIYIYIYYWNYGSICAKRKNIRKTLQKMLFMNVHWKWFPNL